METDFKKALIIGEWSCIWNFVVLWFSKEIIVTSATFFQQIIFNVGLISLILVLIVYYLSKKKLFYISFVPSIWILVNVPFFQFTEVHTFGYWILSSLLISTPIGLALYSIRDWIIKK